MSGRGRGRNNDSESKYPDEDYLNEYWRHREEENNNNAGYHNNNNNNYVPNNYNYNLEYQEWRAQQEAAANQPNYWPENEEEAERQAYFEEQRALRQPRRNLNVQSALANRLPNELIRQVRAFEGPVGERRVNIHPNFPGNPWEPNAFLPVPRNREVNPELPGNPWEANAFPSKWGRLAWPPKAAAPSTGRWRRKNRKTRRATRKLRRSQRKNRK